MFLLRVIVFLGLAYLCTAGPAIAAAIRAAIAAERFALAARLSNNVLAKSFGVRYISGINKAGKAVDYTFINGKLYYYNTAAVIGTPIVAGAAGGAYAGIVSDPNLGPKEEDLKGKEVTDADEIISVANAVSSMISADSVKWSSIQSKRSSSAIAKYHSQLAESASYETGGKVQASKSFNSWISKLESISSDSAWWATNGSIEASKSFNSMVSALESKSLASVEASKSAQANKNAKAPRAAPIAITTVPEPTARSVSEAPITTLMFGGNIQLTPRSLPQPPAPHFAELPPNNETYTRPQEIPNGYPEYEYRLCQYDVMIQEGKDQQPFVIRPYDSSVIVENIPPNCMMLAYTLLGDPQHEPHPVIVGESGLRWDNIHPEDVDFLRQVLKDLLED